MSYQKKNSCQEEPRCVICSSGFYFRDPTHPFGAKCPLVLHCGHSACEGCLTAGLQTKGVLTCPVCNTVSETKKIDPKNLKKSEILSLREDFPLNVYAVGQVSLKKSKSRVGGEDLIKFSSKSKGAKDAKAVYCNECNGKAADCSCLQCKTQLCSGCFTSIHSLSVTLRKHEKISLEEMETNELFEENMCKIHNGLFLNIFCKDCDIYMCKECSLEKHLEHRCTDVFQQNEAKVPEFLELFNEANGVLRQLHATRKKLKGPGNRDQLYDEEAQKVERQVQVHFSSLHGLLQLQEGELLKKIHSVVDESRKSLEIVAVEMEKNIKEVENILSVTSTTVASNKIKEFPLDCLIEKLRNITGTPCHLALNSDGENSMFGFDVDSSITEALTDHCTVNIPTTREFELYSKSELPKSYEVENLEDIPVPFVQPDLKHLITVKEERSSAENFAQMALVSAIAAPTQTLPPTEAKTKPQDSVRKNRIPLQQKNLGNHSASLHSVSSQDSSLSRICKVQPLVEGTTEIVQICHLLSPNSFFVQRKCNQGDINKIRDYFSKNANRSKNPPTVIEQGQMYLALYSRDKKWYRGRVISVYNDFCDIFYVDYGNTEQRVPKKKLRDIPEQYLEIPDQALHCGLHNCSPLGGMWTIEANSLIMNMACGADLSMYVERINQRIGFHEVHLRKADETSGSLTDALIYSGYATRTESTNIEGGLFKFQQPAYAIKKNPFKDTLIKHHEVFDGRIEHINTPSHFYMQKITDGGELMINMMKELSNTYSRMNENQGLIFTPSVGMPVASRFLKDGGWYRAIVLSIPEARKVQVKYVDFGNVETVGIEDVRELQDKFLRVGAQALKCSLYDVASKHPKGWPASATSAFRNLVKDVPLLRAYVEEVKDDNSLKIVLYQTTENKFINISGTLVKMGHANSTGRTSAQAEFTSRPDYGPQEELKVSDSGSVVSEFSRLSKTSEASSKRIKRAGSNESESLNLNKLISGLRTSHTEEASDQGIDGRVKVQVLKVISPAEIYITPNMNTPKLMNKLINDMTAHYSSLAQDEIDRDWEVENLCAVLRQQDNKWYRGIITEVCHTKYKVFIKDIVEVVVVDRCMLHSLEDRFCKVVDGSIKVHLGGVKIPAGLKVWPASTTDYLRRVLEETEFLYIEQMDEVVNHSLPVRLWKRIQKQGGPLEPIKDEWSDINDSLVLIGFALAENRTVSSTPVTSKDNYVMTWLINSFQMAAEAPKVSYAAELENVAVDAPKASHTAELENMGAVTSSVSRAVEFENGNLITEKPTRGNQRMRSNRGRFPSTRAGYIPTIIGPEGPEMVTEWKPAAPLKKLQFFGQPTYVDYDCNIFIQDIDNCGPTLELLEKAFLSLFENSEKRPYEEEYIEGQICVAFYETNKKWYRGQVLKVKPEHIEVLFVDYGNVEELQPEQLRKQVTMGHIPIQCHKCHLEGVFPVSSDGKWPIRTLDFIHAAIVEKRCQVSLKASPDSCEEYMILSIKLPGGEDLLETLLSMHYANYAIDCEALETEEEIIQDEDEDNEVQAAFSNTLTSKAMAQNVHSSFKTPNAFSPIPKSKEEQLIEDHVKCLQFSEYGPQSYDWYDMVENQVEQSISPAFLSELDTMPRLDLKYKDVILPDSMVEFHVEVLTVCSYNSIKVSITHCDDPEIMANLNEFCKLSSVMQDEAESLAKVLFPVKGLVCVGCYTEDNSWYRAVVKDVFPDENKVSVYYVDYGNVEKIPTNRLREIKPEWTLTPVQAFQVTLHNVRKGPLFEPDMCHAAFNTCFMSPPYTMAIESRFPSLEVEVYNNDGEIAYKPLLDSGVITKD